jgi:ABC-2 type transport system ATP-binding protein
VILSISNWRDNRRPPAAPSPSITPVSIQTHNAWVEFPIFDARMRSVKKTFLGKAGGTIGRTGSNVPVIEALRNITISLSVGDRVGLVGHNGAGKSTLPRLLSGIYEPTRGSATIRGRVASIFDLGVGMDPEISGYENIIIRGLFLGETRKSMHAKVDEIAAFTELGDYLSMPLRTYSTGMRVRLAIGVVTSIDPESCCSTRRSGRSTPTFCSKHSRACRSCPKDAPKRVLAIASRFRLPRFQSEGAHTIRAPLSA